MDFLPFGYIDGLKRFWRRRRYQRLDDSIRMRRRLKIVRLGRTTSSHVELKPKKGQNSRFKIITPMKSLAKLHEACLDAMTRLAGTKRIDCGKNEFKRDAKCKPIPMVSASTSEMIDGRVVLEMYKRVVSTRESH